MIIIYSIRISEIFLALENEFIVYTETVWRNHLYEFRFCINYAFLNDFTNNQINKCWFECKSSMQKKLLFKELIM